MPLRLELGPRDLASNQGVLVRRDTREKTPDVARRTGRGRGRAADAHAGGHARSRRASGASSTAFAHAISYDDFRALMDGEGGFVYAGWCGDAACEAQIKEETKATIRVLPDAEFRSAEAPTKCLRCGRAADSRGGVGQGVLTTGFTARRTGVLQCEGVPLERIARDVGTPAYVYSAATIRDRYARLDAHARAACRTAFTTRSRPTRAAGCSRCCVARRRRRCRVRRRTARARCAPGSRRATSFSAASGRRSASSPKRSTPTSCSSTSSAKRSFGCSIGWRASAESTARVSLRVNPEVTLETPHDYIKTGGRGHKFGIPYDDVVHVATVAAELRNVTLLGLDMHLGLAAHADRPVSRGRRAAGRDLTTSSRASGIDTMRVSRHRRRAGRALRHRAAARPRALRVARACRPVAKTGLS